MEQKRCSWQTIKKKITRNRWRKTRKTNEITELLRRDRKRDMDAREDLEQVFF
jgi:hypothetical protein